MFCAKCGTELPNDTAFCVKCGNASTTTKVEIELKENNKETEKSGCGTSIVQILIGLALFYFGGWGFYEVTFWSQTDDVMIIDSDKLLIYLNGSYYGLMSKPRFFNSAMIQWAMLGFSLSLIFYTIKYMFTKS
jgi:hypothetical protein